MYGYTVDCPDEDAEVGDADREEEGAEFRVVGVGELGAEGVLVLV